MEIKCQMIDVKDKIISLTIDKNSKLVEKVDCRFFKEMKDKFSCKIISDNPRKCLFDKLDISQIELYKKSDTFIQSMIGKCYNCDDLTVSSLVKSGGFREIPEGLSYGKSYLSSGAFLKLDLCSSCDDKMDKEIMDIHKKYGAKD